MINDPEIKIIVEVLGGIEPAYSFVKRALESGRSVCTSNKELVAKHGVELLEIARSKDINFLFEASCGGGIPIIRPLNSSLTADEIDEITGILNGTTNYIMTKMSADGSDFDEVLKDAQEKRGMQSAIRRRTWKAMTPAEKSRFSPHWHSEGLWTTKMSIQKALRK